MKRIFILLSPWTFALLIGCGGGGGSEEPPKALKSAKPEESRKDMQMAADRMKQTCANAGGPFVVQTAAVYHFPAASAYANQIQPPQLNECRNDVMNFAMSWSTYYGEEANDAGPTQYFVNQFKSVANQWGQKLMQVGIAPTPGLVAHLVSQGRPYVEPYMNGFRGGGIPLNAGNILMAQGNAALNFR